MKGLNVTVLILLITCQIHSYAQQTTSRIQKIGYVNTEMLLFYMPGYLSINDSLNVWKQEADQQLRVKQNYAKLKLEEYYQQGGLMREEEKGRLENEIYQLQQEIKNYISRSELKLEKRRSLWIGSYLLKIDSVAKIIAREEGYTLILNQSLENGISNLLYGPESENLMPRFASRLGISLPEAYPAIYKNAQREME